MSAGLVDGAIYVKLNVAGITATLAPGGIHRKKAPRGTAYPFVVFSLDTPGEITDVLSGEAWFSGDWTVKVVDKSESAAAAEAAYQAVHALLQGASLTMTGYTPMYCRRQTFFAYDEDLEGGETVQHVGGTYRIMADPT